MLLLKPQTAYNSNYHETLFFTAIIIIALFSVAGRYIYIFVSTDYYFCQIDTCLHTHYIYIYQFPSVRVQVYVSRIRKRVIFVFIYIFSLRTYTYIRSHRHATTATKQLNRRLSRLYVRYVRYIYICHYIIWIVEKCLSFPSTPNE